MQVTSLIIAELGYYHGAHFCLLLGCGSKRAGGADRQFCVLRQRLASGPSTRRWRGGETGGPACSPSTRCCTSGCGATWCAATRLPALCAGLRRAGRARWRHCAVGVLGRDGAPGRRGAAPAGGGAGLSIDHFLAQTRKGSNGYGSSSFLVSCLSNDNVNVFLVDEDYQDYQRSEECGFEVGTHI